MFDQVASAESTTFIQNKEYYLQRQSTIWTVIQAYYYAVEDQKQVEVSIEAVDAAEKLLDDSKRREEEGLVAEIDVYRADIQVEQTKEVLVAQQQTARTAMDALMIAMGQGIGQTPQLDTDKGVPDVSEAEIPTVDKAKMNAVLDADIRKALANRGEVIVYDNQISEQKRKLELANDNLRPALNAIASINSANTTAGLLDSSFLNTGLFNIGVAYTFSLDRRIDKENRDTTARDLDVLQRSRLFQIDQVKQDVRTAYIAVETARESLEVLQSNVDAADKSLHAAQRMVDEGIADNRNVVDAVTARAQAQSGLLSAKIALYLAAVNLKYVMGEDLTGMGS
jgi:outer membrane protein TolC